MSTEHTLSPSTIPWLPEGMKAADLRFQWANKHVAALNEVIKEFNASSPWKAATEPNLPEGMVRIRIFNNPPDEIGLIIGDIVHSLRAALDYATCALVAIGDPDADLRRIQFPFGKQGEPLNSAARAPLKCIEEFGLPWIEYARTTAGPYLSVLNRASNQDKHRLILLSMMRQMPMKVEIDPTTNTGDIVIDPSRLDVWMAPISDGDAIPMTNMLALRPGFFIEGDDAPHSLDVVGELFHAVRIALTSIFNAARVMLSQQGVCVHIPQQGAEDIR